MCEVKKTEMGKACNTCREEERWGHLRDGKHVQAPSVGGRIILKCIFEKWGGWHGLD
jgi:hypothetical protein